MGILERFFEEHEEQSAHSGGTAAQVAASRPLGLQVLFPEPLCLDSAELTADLREYHPDLREAVFQVDASLAAEGTVLGMASWYRHVVRVVGFNAPMPLEAVELCLQSARYPAALRAGARAHRAHLRLSYAGSDQRPLEQYVALAVVSGVLAASGALVVLNESALASFPAASLAAENIDGDTLNLLHSLPVPALYCGFVELEAPDGHGVWMRTYGAPRLGIPDLASFTAGHSDAVRVFEMFSNVMHYVLETGAMISGGHTMQISPDIYLKLREPASGEQFLQSAEKILVVERISSGETNRLKQPV